MDTKYSDLIAIAKELQPVDLQEQNFLESYRVDVHVKRWKEYGNSLSEKPLELTTIRFEQVILLQESPQSRPFYTAPSLIQLQTFFRWLVREKKGLRGKLCIRTLHRWWCDLKRLVSIRANHAYTTSEDRCMKKVITLKVFRIDPR